MVSLSPALRGQREEVIVKLSPTLRTIINGVDPDRVSNAIAHVLGVVAYRVPDWWCYDETEPASAAKSTRLWLHPDVLAQINKHTKTTGVPRRRVLEALLHRACVDEHNALYQVANAA